MLASTATAINATGGGNGDNPSNISGSDIDGVTTMLRSNDAWMILANQRGEDRFSTGPTRDAFLGLCHTNVEKNLNTLNGFISKWNYPNPNETIRSEWGSYNNVRFMTSSVGSVVPNASALGNDVYNVFIQGLEAIAAVEQDNFSAQFLYRPPVYSDALFQNITLGYVFAEVPRILADFWIARLRITLR